MEEARTMTTAIYSRHCAYGRVTRTTRPLCRVAPDADDDRHCRYEHDAPDYSPTCWEFDIESGTYELSEAQADAQFLDECGVEVS